MAMAGSRTRRDRSHPPTFSGVFFVQLRLLPRRALLVRGLRPPPGALRLRVAGLLPVPRLMLIDCSLPPA
eukprot:1957516-Alexandrium_andersonii.AAC.1